MLQLNVILEYFPRTHGEHGVDATIHELIKDSHELHEAYSNPPGGSWAELDLIHPNTGTFYRWDHIPRVAINAKRPDSVIQYNEDNVINLLLMESKKQWNNYYEDMKSLLIQYFTGSNGFNGLLNRPAWHYRRGDSEEWIFLFEDSSGQKHYWFKNIDDSQVNFLAGFSYALTPEYYNLLSGVNYDKIIMQQDILIKSEDIDVVIGIGWHDRFHYPFAIITYDDDFESTNFGNVLKSSFASIDYNNIIDSDE